MEGKPDELPGFPVLMFCNSQEKKIETVRQLWNCFLSPNEV